MGIFGWDLPPGCTHKMLDDAMGVNEQCEMCGNHVDDCICPECLQCSEYGDPECYSKHGLVIDAAQLAGMEAAFEDLLNELRVDDARYAQWEEDKRLEQKWLDSMAPKTK